MRAHGTPALAPVPLGRIADLRLAPALVAGVASVALATRRWSPTRRQQLHRACSTNVRNLSEHRWWVLGASLVVLDGPARPSGLLGLLGVLGAGELLWGPARLAAVVAGGHVGATLVVDAGLRAGLARGLVDPAVRDTVDVGTSYAALAVAGALAGALPHRRSRAVLVTGLGALMGAPLGRSPSATDAGHAVAAALGVAGGGPLRAYTPPVLRWPPVGVSGLRLPAAAPGWAPPRGRAGRRR